MLTLPDVRLITLIGPAGVGKTHLALQLAQDLRDHFPDGVRFIDLSPISQAALVAPTMAQALNLTEDSQQEPAAALQAALREQRMLLVLDNLEQVVDVAPELAQLLAAAPASRCCSPAGWRCGCAPSMSSACRRWWCLILGICRRSTAWRRSNRQRCCWRGCAR